MIFQKKYKIGEWTKSKWSTTIAEAITDFNKQFSFFPNILQANSHVFSQFDFLVNIDPSEKQNVKKQDTTNEQHAEVNDDDTIVLSGFKHRLASLEFATDESISDEYIRLIYDSDPDWEESENINIPDDFLLEKFEKSLVY